MQPAAGLLSVQPSSLVFTGISTPLVSMIVTQSTIAGEFSAAIHRLTGTAGPGGLLFEAASYVVKRGSAPGMRGAGIRHHTRSQTGQRLRARWACRSGPGRSHVARLCRRSRRMRRRRLCGRLWADDWRDAVYFPLLGQAACAAIAGINRAQNGVAVRVALAPGGPPTRGRCWLCLQHQAA